MEPIDWRTIRTHGCCVWIWFDTLCEFVFMTMWEWNWNMTGHGPSRLPRSTSVLHSRCLNILHFFHRSVRASSRAVVWTVGSVYRARSRSLPVLMNCWHECPDWLTAGPDQDWCRGHCGEKLRLLFRVMSDGQGPAVLRLTGLNLPFREMFNNI